MKIGAIEMIPVVSSQLAMIGYDPEVQTLAVAFPKGRSSVGSVYLYFGVPKTCFDAFLAAESKGTYFGENIKGHDPKAPHFPVRRICHLVDHGEEYEVVWLDNTCPNCSTSHRGDIRCSLI